MNSSAKMTTLSFLAAAALGAVVFTGCTVSSGTSNDTDGGTQNNDEKDAGSTDETDAGETPDSGDVKACETNDKQTAPLISAECQSCLDTSCCSQLTACFSIPGDEQAGTVDCNVYAKCIADCGEKQGDELTKCYEECDLVAAEGVAQGYDGVVTCAATNCKTPCGVE